MPEPPAVVVVGSLNVDHVVVAETFPRPGETVRGRSAHQSVGGKGANQAVAAALTGVDVTLVARAGSDPEGANALKELAARGVDVTGVEVVDDTPTGTAWITVADDDNTIVIIPGANAKWPTDDDAAPPVARTARVVLAQLEIPLPVVLRSAAHCTGLFVLNAAPAADLPDQLLDRCDVLVVNEHELATVSRMPGAGGSRTNLDLAHQALHRRGVAVVVTTLGSHGAVVTDRQGTSSFIEPVPAVTVDTTGAGDAFTGVLAGRMCLGDSPTQAARWATAAGSLAVRRSGTQSSYPDPTTLAQTVQEMPIR